MRILWLALAALLFCACSHQTPLPRRGIVATTVHLEEIVRAVVGEHRPVELLVPRGADPHAFEPSPQDVKKLATCQILFCNGAGLEGWLQRLVQQGLENPDVVVVDLSRGLPLKTTGHEVDPHIWLDPRLMIRATVTVAEHMARLEPALAPGYRQRADIHVGRLQELDRWSQERLSRIPKTRRKIVTSHDALGYFARRYDFVIEGTVIAGVSTEAAETSAAELQRLVKRIQATGTPAIFSESGQSPRVYELLAREAGVKLVPDLFLDSLGPEGSPTATYEGAFRWNVERIAEALQ